MPQGPQKPPGGLQGAILEPSGTHFGTISGPISKQFGNILEPFSNMSLSLRCLPGSLLGGRFSDTPRHFATWQPHFQMVLRVGGCPRQRLQLFEIFRNFSIFNVNFYLILRISEIIQICFENFQKCEEKASVQILFPSTVCPRHFLVS